MRTNSWFDCSFFWLPCTKLVTRDKSVIGQVQVQQVLVQILGTKKMYFGLYLDTFYLSTSVLSTSTNYKCTWVQ
jgi:hypothetical protein